MSSIISAAGGAILMLLAHFVPFFHQNEIVFFCGGLIGFVIGRIAGIFSKEV